MIHPSGDRHWTRARPELRRPWAKLQPRQIEQLCALYKMGSSQSHLARRYKIGRTTVWRYLKARNLLPNQANNR